MKTDIHKIDFKDKIYNKQINWIELSEFHLKCVEKRVTVRMFRRIISSTKKSGGDKFFYRFPYVVEFNLINTNLDEDNRFVQKVLNLGRRYPMVIGNELNIRFGFDSFNEAMEFSQINQDKIVRLAETSISI